MRAKKLDGTHRAIADHLRAIGWDVLSLASLGKGVPDLLVAYDGFTALVECKSQGGSLTPDQERFHAAWGGVIVIAYTPQEAERQLWLNQRWPA